MQEITVKYLIRNKKPTKTRKDDLKFVLKLISKQHGDINQKLSKALEMVNKTFENPTPYNKMNIYQIERMMLWSLNHKPVECELCGLKKWLTMHHKDGNRNNNEPKNLRLLCWNHHLGEMENKGYTSKDIEEVICFW